MRLDNNLAALVLGETARLELRVPMRWETRAAAVRAQMGVHNAHALPLLLGVQVLIPKPWKLTAYLMIYGQHLRRLDVNGSHGNRTGDREVWNERTHKHTFSEQHQDTVAYTPSDIPAVPMANVMGEHYRGAFEAFCGEQAIKLTGEYRWIDPSVADTLGGDWMTECSTLLSSVLAGESSRWTCRKVSSDTVLLVTSHHYADGDTVELMVQTVDDEVIVSDGGEVLARLDSVGVNVDSRSRVGKSWKRLMAAHALEDDRGQLVRRASIEHAAELVREMADAVANLDGLRVLAPAPRRLAFPERLTTYLEAEFPFVEPRAKLTGASGWPYRVTAAAGTSEEQPIYVQVASGQNTAAQKSAVEHCFTMFSDVNGHLPAKRKLVVLNDEATPMWRPEMITLLSGVAYVGTWTARDQWTEFVWGNVPESRLMLPPEQSTLG